MQYTPTHMEQARALSPRQALAQSYRLLSPFSDSDAWEFESHLRHLNFCLRVLEKLPPGATVVDVGCYIGILPLALRLLGVDASGNDKYIFQSREKGKAYGFSPQELEALKKIWDAHGLRVDALDVTQSKSAKQYDVVLSIATIEHQPYPKQFLENVASFAKKGGTIYIATPNVAKLANRFRFLLGRPPMSNLQEFYMNAHEFNGHWREYTRAELRDMAVLSGLHVEEYASVQMEPVNFQFNRPGKWARSIARLFAYVIPGTGDMNILILKK
jgi:2-polyprenyl-3-methyl-5-hydroxy-6-metoxy-1,4-benzoquinol methylase